MYKPEHSDTSSSGHFIYLIFYGRRQLFSTPIKKGHKWECLINVTKKKERYICYVWYLKSKVRQMKIKKDPTFMGLYSVNVTSHYKINYLNGP